MRLFKFYAALSLILIVIAWAVSMHVSYVQYQRLFTPTSNAMHDQETLLSIARGSLGVYQVDEEKLFYVKADYFRLTREHPHYGSDPDHPFFVYTMKGKIHPFTGLGPAPSSLPEDKAPPTPYYLPLDSGTVILDAVRLDTVYYGRNVFIDEISPDVLPEEYGYYWSVSSQLDASIKPVDPVVVQTMFPEVTAEAPN